jgi:phosphatidylserine/phosphatidylglycerophosphate/cardiolipin synthase-like enzyme
VFTLTDGGQPAAQTADRLARFIDGARSSLDLAVYDVHLGATTQATVRGALERARGRSVAIRFMHNEAMDAKTSGPPPPRTDPAVVAGLGIQTIAFPGVPDLMHHKYVVRDRSAVWAGSANWSDDSWTREENVVVIVASAELAAVYLDDFEQLWRSRDVARGGRVSTAPVNVGGTAVRPWFTPGHASGLVHRIAAAIGHAQRRVRVSSPVITSGPILGTIAEVAEDRRVDLGIAIDGTQIHEVLRQWAHQRGWKRATLERIAHDERTSAKASTPWGIGTVHDFMHAKVTVADDVVFVGSYNLSRSGETNAEDVLEIADRALADRLAVFIDDLRRRYPRFA